MLRVVWACVDRKHILHRRNKLSIFIRRYFPILAQMRLKRIFFNVLQTVIGETLGTKFNSTSVSASSRTVQRLRPVGGSEQASANSCASNSPPNRISRGGVSRCFRSMAAGSPASTNRFFRCSRLRGVLPTASPTRATVHFGPCSPASRRSKARADNTVRAALFPLLEIACKSSRSSSVRVTLYLGAIALSPRC